MKWMGRPESDNVVIASPFRMHVQDKSRRQRGQEDNLATERALQNLQNTPPPTGINLAGQQQQNVTLDWLATNHPDLAAAVVSGTLPIATAVQAAVYRQQAPK